MSSGTASSVAFTPLQVISNTLKLTPPKLIRIDWVQTRLDLEDEFRRVVKWHISAPDCYYSNS